MEHHGDYVNALHRHTARAAERYGALTAQPAAAAEEAPLEAAAAGPHPPDEETDDER